MQSVAYYYLDYMSDFLFATESKNVVLELKGKMASARTLLKVYRSVSLTETKTL